MELTQVDVESRDDGKVCLAIEVSPEEVRRAVHDMYRELRRRVVVPGFRKGKVPPAILKQRIGVDTFTRMVEEKIVPGAYQQAIEQAKLRPVEEATMEQAEWTEGAPLRFKAVVTVAPEPELGEYLGVPGERRVRAVGEDEVERTIARFREQFAKWEAAAGKEAQIGDRVLGTSVIRAVDDPDIEPKERSVVIVLGEEGLLPVLTEGLTGVRTGETRTVSFVYPVDGGDEELAGKPVEMTIAVEEVQVRRVPELTGDFVREFARSLQDGAEKVEPESSPEGELANVTTVPELREATRKRLETGRWEQSQKELEDDLVAVVVGRSKVDVPKSLVDKEIEAQLARMDSRMQRQGLSLAGYLERTGLTKEKLGEEFRPEATSTVRRELVLEAIARRENLEPTEDEIDKEVAALAQRLGIDPTVFREHMEEQGLVLQVQRHLRERKAIQFVVDHAVIEETVIPPEEPAASEEASPEPERPVAAEGPANGKTDQAPSTAGPGAAAPDPGDTEGTAAVAKETTETATPPTGAPGMTPEA